MSNEEPVPTMQELLTEWADVMRAFKGAFDTPVKMRRYEDSQDEYAKDAVARVRMFSEKMERVKKALTGEPAEYQPVGTVNMQTSPHYVLGIKWNLWTLPHGTTLYAHIKDMSK